MNEVEIKNNFSKNVRELRIDRKLNQIQLGEKLNYTSKAVSKWENGDVMPDIVTLKMIADFFDISVDTLISDKNVIRKSHKKKRRLLITAVSALLSFFVASIVFYILLLVHVDKSWLSFIVAIPVSGIVLIVFSSLWFKRAYLTMSIVYTSIGIGLTAMFFTNFYLWWVTLIAVSLFIVLTIIFIPIIITNNRK